MPTSSENEKILVKIHRNPLADLLTLPWSHIELFYYGGKGKQTETIPSGLLVENKSGNKTNQKLLFTSGLDFPQK
jgi:hypothetical protein